MGNKIHLHIEAKINDKWEHYSAPSMQRDDHTFAFMASTNPKGLPDDITLITKLDHENTGNAAHNESWLNKNEIYGLGEWLRNTKKQDLEYDILNAYFFGNAFYSLPTSKILSCVTDVRLVFWFDIYTPQLKNEGVHMVNVELTQTEANRILISNIELLNDFKLMLKSAVAQNDSDKIFGLSKNIEKVEQVNLKFIAAGAKTD